MSSDKFIDDGGRLFHVTLHNCGAYGDIFKLKNENKVIKLFKARHDKLENFIVENTFRSELLAYNRVINSHNINLAPRFYGKITITSAEINGLNVIGNFLGHCAYIIEFIPFRFNKVGNDSNAKEAIKTLKGIGINYTIDADYCVINGNYKFIDFGIIGVREELDTWLFEDNIDVKISNFYSKHPYLMP